MGTISNETVRKKKDATSMILYVKLLPENDFAQIMRKFCAKMGMPRFG
jgi:hypothetical protein